MSTLSAAKPEANPVASRWTQAPLRNRLRVELRAPIGEVWALVGDLGRFPEYSAGLERVVAEHDASGALAAYVCHFKPRSEGEAGIVERNDMRWYEPERGYASSGEKGNAFGLTNDIHLLTVESMQGGTLLIMDEYFDARDLDLNRAEFDQAFADTGARLVARFGGRVFERYVEGARPATGAKMETNYDVQSIALHVPASKAHAFIADPAQLPKWTGAFAAIMPGRAVMRTPRGEVTVELRVEAYAESGTVDWYMTFPDGSTGKAFSRVVELDRRRCAYVFVLTPPPVPLEQLEGALAAQSRTLAEELNKLKEVLEHRA